MESSLYSANIDSTKNFCKNCSSEHQFSERGNYFILQPTVSSQSRRPKKFLMGYAGRIAKVGVLVFFSLMFMGVYVTYFKHPPPDVLLVMNSKSLSLDSHNDFGASSFQKKEKKTDLSENNNDSNDEAEDDEKTENKDTIRHSKRELVEEVKGTAYWDKFLKQHNYVPIGAVYDKCEGSKTQLGTVILEKDEDLGGIRARTFANLTIEDEITDGKFYIEVKYNGKDLYDNYWSICELEDNLPVQNRTFNCPVTSGKYSKIKDKHVPGYLPTGRYQTKAWAVDDAEKVIACGYSDFKL